MTYSECDNFGGTTIAPTDKCLQTRGELALVAEARLMLRYVLDIPLDTIVPPYNSPGSPSSNTSPLSEISEYDCLDGGMCLELRRCSPVKFADGYKPTLVDAIAAEAKARLTITDLNAETGEPLMSGRTSRPLASLYLLEHVIFVQLFDDKGKQRDFVPVTEDEVEIEALGALIDWLDLFATDRQAATLVDTKMPRPVRLDLEQQL